jgi:peptide/nickel transport system substrate-binding protein
MKKKFVIVVLSLVVVLSLLLASCAAKTTSTTSAPTTTSSKPVTTTTSAPTQANWWDKLGIPKYGGTLIRTAVSIATDFDGYSAVGGQFNTYGEALFDPNWATDRSVWGFTTAFTPPDYLEGCLAKTWEQTDPTTITVYLRQGVHWQNKAPTNGREFVADDVVAHYDRILGIGTSKSPPSPFNAGRIDAVDRVIATDKYTVQIKFKTPGVVGFLQLLDNGGQNIIEAPEWVSLAPPVTAAEGGGGPPGGGSAAPSGPLSDWHNAVGTSAWILTDYVAGTSDTYSRNPDYWGSDERYPQNKLPYADTLKELQIPDTATAIAALRTAKIDLMTSLSFEQSQSLSKTNTDLKQAKLPFGAQSLDMMFGVKPFDDIRVRQAMQLAIDTQMIARTHYGGAVDGLPAGLANPVIAAAGWGFAYKDWPQSLKDEYTYNPTKAKQLLKDAGYPDGFKTNIIAPSAAADMELIQIFKAELMEIGIDMEIRAMDMPAWINLAMMRKADQLNWDPMGKSGAVVNLSTIIGLYTPTDHANFNGVNDETYNGMVQKFRSAASWDEAKQLSRQIDQYVLEQHWDVSACPSCSFTIWQPYLGGYSGEAIGLGGLDNSIWSRLWVNK